MAVSITGHRAYIRGAPELRGALENYVRSAPAQSDSRDASRVLLQAMLNYKDNFLRSCLDASRVTSQKADFERLGEQLPLLPAEEGPVDSNTAHELEDVLDQAVNLARLLAHSYVGSEHVLRILLTREDQYLLTLIERAGCTRASFAETLSTLLAPSRRGDFFWLAAAVALLVCMVLGFLGFMLHWLGVV